MRFVDLSRLIEQRTAVHPNHPPVIMSVWNDHSMPYQLEGETFTSKSLHLSFGDHVGTHVDAPVHFSAAADAASVDQIPLEDFYTEAVCLDLSHKPLKSLISVEELIEAEKRAGVAIKPRDTVLIYMEFYKRTWGTKAFLHDFPGIAEDGVRWLGSKGIVAFGVEAVSVGIEGAQNMRVHRLCGEIGITHYECLVNLDQLVGKGRFRFIAFPLKLKGGSASPVRAVALLDE